MEEGKVIERNRKRQKNSFFKLIRLIFGWRNH